MAVQETRHPVRDIASAFDWWRSKQRSNAKSVMLFVAAAGGGARASYWTSIVLGRLTDLVPSEVRDRLFVASGVSGGALGVAVHRALLAHETVECGRGQSGRLEQCARRFGEGDFLGGLRGLRFMALF